MPWFDATAALPSFVIALREGVEAALVVGIVVAYLHKSEQRQYYPWVAAGVVLGLLSSAGVGLVVAHWLAQLAGLPQAAIIQPAVVAGFEVLAIAILSWMLLWMTRQARMIKQEVQTSVAAAVARGTGWGLFGLVWSAIVREGFEAVVFVLSQAELGPPAWVGAAAGAGFAIAIGFALFRWGVRLNVAQFFQTLGIVLLLLVGGLVISLLAHTDRALVAAYGCEGTCILGWQLWDWHTWLPQNALPGIIFKLLLGYRDRFYALQALAYGVFWLTIGRAYWQSLTPRPQPEQAR